MNRLPRDKKCLVIGPYGKPGSPERQWSDWVLEKIVRPVADEFGYVADRTIDEPRPGKITTRIMADLRAADLVVADLTGSNPNVYYELALRHATARPFIHLVDQGAQIPFDIAVMNVIEIVQGKEAEAREQLRFQFASLRTGRVNFQTDACPPQARLQAQAYEWEIAYARDLAEEWLKKQNSAVRRAVDDFNSQGGHPAGEFLKNSLLEYLAYRIAHGTTTTVDLYYVVDTVNRHFSGWGVAPPVEGRGPLPIRVTGYEKTEGRRIDLRFSQPLMPIKIGDLEGVVGPFEYNVEFEASEGRAGELEGKFFHPQCPDVLVGMSLLRCKAG